MHFKWSSTASSVQKYRWKSWLELKLDRFSNPRKCNEDLAQVLHTRLMLEKSWIIDAKWKPSWRRSLGVIITRVVKANLNKLLWSSRWASLKGKKIEEGSLVDNKKLSFFDKWMIWVVSGPHKRLHCWRKRSIPYAALMIEDVRRGLKVKPLIPAIHHQSHYQ